MFINNKYNQFKKNTYIRNQKIFEILLREAQSYYVLFIRYCYFLVALQICK